MKTPWQASAGSRDTPAQSHRNRRRTRDNSGSPRHARPMRCAGAARRAPPPAAGRSDQTGGSGTQSPGVWMSGCLVILRCFSVGLRSPGVSPSMPGTGRTCGRLGDRPRRARPALCRAAALEQPALGERHRAAPRHHQVVEHAHVDQCQRGAQRLVSTSSASDGSGLPLGWLCARMTRRASWCSARRITSRG